MSSKLVIFTLIVVLCFVLMFDRRSFSKSNITAGSSTSATQQEQESVIVRTTTSSSSSTSEEEDKRRTPSSSGSGNSDSNPGSDNVKHHRPLKTSDPTETSSQQHLHDVGSSFFPKHNGRGATHLDGTVKLWAYELPQSNESEVLSVTLAKRRRASSPDLKALMRNVTTSRSVGGGVTFTVPIEPVDLAINIPMKRKQCNRLLKKKSAGGDEVPAGGGGGNNKQLTTKRTETAAECFHKLMLKSNDILFERVTTRLNLLPRFISILPSPQQQQQQQQQVAAQHQTRRYFFYDIGARSFDSMSTKWFMERYPGSEHFHAAAFEMDRRFEKTFPAKALRRHFQSWQFVNAAVWINDDGVKWDGRDMGAVVAPEAKYSTNPDFDPNSSKNQHQKKKISRGGGGGGGGNQDGARVGSSGATSSTTTKTVPSIDLARFLKSNHTMDDFIVVKMDIEGAEWPIVERLIDTGAIHFIDEMFFECHVQERFPVMHPKCVDLINLLRRMGVFCHRWV